jgi:transposase
LLVVKELFLHEQYKTEHEFQQSLVSFALKHGVSRASRKYNKTRSYIYFGYQRYKGTIESLACRSRRPHPHPNQHTEEELDLLRRMRRRNPDLGLYEFWCRMRKRRYFRSIVSLYRVMRRIGLQPISPKPKYVPNHMNKKKYPVSVYKLMSSLCPYLV